MAPVPVQKDDSVAPAVALREGKVHVLDTDYQNYLFLCLEAGAAPTPAERSLACQYLGACLPGLCEPAGGGQGEREGRLQGPWMAGAGAGW